MKKLILILLTVFTLSSCKEKGTTTQSIYGNETQLPDELKGMEVYDVSGGQGTWFKVAILPDKQVNSITYMQGKTTATTIIINPNSNNQRTIIAREIISENDSIIVLKK